MRPVFRARAQVWHIKYTRLFWRPVTAINQGDGTNAADPTWTPFLATPPHPEYDVSHHKLYIVVHDVILDFNYPPDNCFEALRFGCAYSSRIAV